jgi:hypothetical protein
MHECVSGIRMTDEVFASLSARFTKMYSAMGRWSIPPEQLLRTLLIQSLYTVRLAPLAPLARRISSTHPHL